VVGYQAAIPLAEPEVCPVFCRKFIKRVENSCGQSWKNLEQVRTKTSLSQAKIQGN
jgi:hypothetical protein